MKITLAQINTTPNDFSGNFARIHNGIEAALKDQSDVVVFPELTLPGYLVKDLVYTTGFIEKNLYYLQEVAKLTSHNDMTVIVGYIDRNYKGVGKPFRNMAAVIRDGIVIATYQKHLLPFYDVFDESRYFEPGTDICVFDIKGKRCGIAICEDCWNDKGQDDYQYLDNPVQKYRVRNIEYLFSINSSPYGQGKPARRIKMLRHITEKWENPINLIYVNQIGGQDELVFDGHSLVMNHGTVIKYLKTDIIPKKDIDQFSTIDVLADNKAPYMDMDADKDHLRMTLLGLHDYITKSGFTSVVLGSSGGVDSAVTAALATLAIGKDNVNCIMMPSIYSSEGSVNDAKELHKRLGCIEHLVPIDNIPFQNHINEHLKFIEFTGSLEVPPEERDDRYYKEVRKYNKVADENLQARMRGQIIMHFSNATGALALTTGNKTELATGYCTLYGDMNGGFNAIGDLYKMEVYAMCKLINGLFKNLIPKEILDKAPSAELRPGQTDEASLLPYPILDFIVKLYIEEYITDYKQYCTAFDRFAMSNSYMTTESEYKRITRLIFINEFKRRQAAPTIKLNKVAFGTGRRIPIVKK